MNIIIKTFSPIFTKILPRLPQAFLGLVIGIILVKITHWFIHSLLKMTKMNPSMIRIVSATIHVILYIILTATVFQMLGLNQIALAISGSIAALVFGLASGSSSYVSDLISGFSLAADKDFDIGYKVKVGGIIGTVIDMDLRKIRIQDEQGYVHVFPNSNVEESEWIIIDKNLMKGRL